MAEIDDTVRTAMDELYANDPDSFTGRRAALVAAAKKNGDVAAAKQISTLRKPTRSAYTVNALARIDPDGITELVELGAHLRQAEQSVDPRQIRELTSHRRRLVNELTKRAFDAIDDTAPSSVVRDEVVSTFTAALADADIAAQVADGTLVKPARWEGFGAGGSPDLTVVGGTGGRGAREPRTTATRRSSPVSRPSAKGMSRADREQARRQSEQQEAERKAQANAAAAAAKRARLADAQQAVEDAEQAYLIATEEEQSRSDRLLELEEEVARARRSVDEARIQVRRSQIRHRRAGDALDRISR